MSSVKIPCPACAATLTLDENNAGERIVCPDCRAVLTMPPIVDGALTPTVVNDGVPDSPLPPARVPFQRAERKDAPRDAALPSASSGDTLPVPPPPAEPLLNPDGTPRARTRLPERRSMNATPATGAQAHAAAARETENPAAPSTDEFGGQLPEAAPVRDIRPISPKGDEIIQPSALPAARRGPSPLPSPPAPVEEAGTPAEPGPRGGHRLGEDRQLHFTPFLPESGDVETSAAWGGAAKSGDKSRRMAVTAAVVVLLLGAGYGVYVWKYGGLAAAQAAAESHSATPKEEEPNPLRNLEAARVVLRRFFAASSVEEMLKEVRHPEITEPRIRQSLAGKTVRPLNIVQESQTWNEARVGDREFITGTVELDDFRWVNVALEIEKDGGVKVDWESYANWAELPWRDFLKTLPETQGDYRVTVTHIRYYNYAFKDKEGEMISFRVEDPERFGYCYAYCDKDSDAAGKLVDGLRKARRIGRVTKEGVPYVNCILRMHYPEEGKVGNQALIDGFVSDSWVLP